MSAYQFCQRLKSRWGQRFTSSAVVIALLTTGVGSACSPGLFFGDGKDQGVLNTTKYRKINTNCGNLSLSSPELDVKTLKGLVDCLNSDHALEPLAALIQRASAEDLNAVLSLSNKYILKDSKLLFELEATFNSLQKNGILDSSIAQLGNLLENPEFISSGLSLLQEQYYLNSMLHFSAGLRSVPILNRLMSTNSFDSDILKGMEKVSEKITVDNAETGINFALSLSSARVFSALQRDFRSPATRNLNDLTDAVLEYARDPQHFEAGRVVLSEIANGDLFDALDEVTGMNNTAVPVSTRLGASIPRLASVLKLNLFQNGELMNATTTLFHYLHRPISCMGGAKQVPDGVMHVIRELVRQEDSHVGDFIKRDNKLILAVLNSTCEFPQEVQQYYPYLAKMASYAPIEPMTDLIKAFFRVERTLPDGSTYHPLTELLVGMLADTGDVPSGPLGFLASSDRPGIKLLIPVLAEISEHGESLTNALLAVSLLPVDQRHKVQEAIQYLLKPVDSLQGKSLYDVFGDAVLRGSQRNVFTFVHSMGFFIDRDEEILRPALTNLRAAFYVNNAHPLIDLTKKVMSEATQNQAFFDAIFRMSTYPEFKDTIGLLSTLAKSPDHQLRQLLATVVTLFHSVAQKGAFPIQEGTQPPFVPTLAHDLIATDHPQVVDFPFLNLENASANQACANIDLNLKLKDYSNSSTYNTQLESLIGCQNSNGRYGDVAEALEFIKSAPVADQAGGTFFGLQMKLLNALNFTTSQMGYMTDKFIESYDNGEFFRILNSLPFFVTESVHGEKDLAGAQGSVLRPLVDMIGPVISKTPDALHRMETFAAGVIQKPEIPGLLSYGEGLLDQALPTAETKCGPSEDLASPFEPSARPNIQTYDRDLIKRWVAARECAVLSKNSARREAQLEARASEIIDDYENTITSWDLKDGRPRRNWEKQEFHDALKPLLDHFADKSNSSANRPLTKALLNVMGYFTLQPGQKPNEKQHYPPEYLSEWLTARSNDYTILNYFYPGEKIPRVRLVNTLDRLELVLINVDFMAPPPISKNMGMEFLSEIGEAWGDEPFEVWPAEIKAKFPQNSGKKPMTITEAVADITNRSTITENLGFLENLVGLPPRENCPQMPGVPDDLKTHLAGLPSWVPFMDVPAIQRTLYNTHLVTSVLTENAPKSGFKTAGGMKVLRDLFFELYYSTPEKYRKFDQASVDHNNLSVVLKLVRMGMTRQASRQLRGWDAHNPELMDFFKSLIESATAQDTNRLVQTLVQDDPTHALLWKMLDPVLDVLDAGVGRLNDLPSEYTSQLEGKNREEQIPVLQKWAKESAYMKQLSFYGLASLHPLGTLKPTFTRSGSPQDFSDRLVNVLANTVAAEKDYLTEHAELVQDILTSRSASLLARGFYENTDLKHKYQLEEIVRDALNDPNRGIDGLEILKAIDHNPKTSNAWHSFKSRLDVIRTQPEFCSLKVGDIFKKTLHFFEEDASVQGADVATRLRIYFGDRLTDGDIDQLMTVAQANPDKFYKVLEVVSNHVENGDLKDFFALVRRSLSEPPR